MSEADSADKAVKLGAATLAGEGQLTVAGIDNYVAEKIREARQGRFTQRALTAILRDEYGLTGFHDTTLARTELAQRSLRMPEFVAICSALGMQPSDLLTVPRSEEIVRAESARADLYVRYGAMRELGKVARLVATRSNEVRQEVIELAEKAGLPPPVLAQAREFEPPIDVDKFEPPIDVDKGTAR